MCLRRHGTRYRTRRKIKELPAPPNCWVVLAKPKIGVSTAEVYGGLKVEGLQHPNTQQMIQAIETKDYELLCSSLGNVLETVTFKLHPEVVMLKEQMKRFGADATLMSGSGPTVFGLVDSEARVSRIYNGLRGFVRKFMQYEFWVSEIRLLRNANLC